MKRYAILLTMACVAALISAQTQSLGVQLGFTEPILRTNSAEVPDKTSNVRTLNGAKVGLVYDATLIKGFGFSMALNYAFSAGGTKWRQEGSSLYPKIRERYMQHTLELPIDWQYKFEIAKRTWLILYTGPTVQYNFISTEQTLKQNLHDKKPVTTTKERVSHYKIDNDNDGLYDYSPLNILWGVGAGFQYKNYYLRGGYDFGIYNHFRDRRYYDDYANHGRLDQWSIKLGIYFLNF